MKRTLKWMGGALLATVLIVAGLAVHSWYWKPFSIDVFFERALLQVAMDDPELLSILGIVEQFGYTAHRSRLTDASPDRAQELVELSEEQLDTLRRYDRASLSTSQQLSYDVLESYLATEVAGREWIFHNYPVNQFNGVQDDVPNLLLQIHQITDESSARAYVSRLAKFGTKFDQVLEGLRLRDSIGVVPPRFVIDRVLAGMRAFVGVPPTQHVLYTHLDAELSGLESISEVTHTDILAAAAREISATVYPAYGRLILFFGNLQKKVNDNHGVWKLPQGDAYYDYLIRWRTTTTLGANAVHELGLAEVARLEAQMDAILDGFGLTEGTIGVRVRQFQDTPAQLYTNDAAGRQQCFDDFARILKEADRAVEPYFNVRPRGKVVVERVPEFLEATAALGSYQQPSLDGTRPGVFYVKLRDMRELPRFTMRTLAYHEAVPGHHFQVALAQELEDVPTFRRIIQFTAYDEGWALYAEQLAAEIGLQANPADDLGRLQAEMFRAVRLVVDTGIHRMRWTRERAIDYMIEKTGQADGDVIAEIERYFVMPAQALAYKIGMIRILELRERARTRLGERFSLSAFHDLVLTRGSVPMDVLEAEVDRWILSGGAARHVPHDPR